FGVGVFASNYALGSSTVGLLAMPMLLSAHPILMAMANTTPFDSGEFERTNTVYMRLFLFVMVPLLLVVVPNAHLIARVALGRAYVGGYALIALALVGSVGAGRLGLLGGGLGTLVGVGLTWPVGTAMLRRYPGARLQLNHFGKTVRTLLGGLKPRA